MAKNKDARVRAAGGFSPGTKVGLAPRHADQPPKNLRAIQESKVDELGAVEFTGLAEGDRFWIFSLDADDDRRALAATAKVPRDGKALLSDSEIRERLAHTRPHRSKGNTITGAKNTVNSRVVSKGGLPFRDGVGKPTAKEDLEHEPQPRLRQEDARDVPQRSATVTGSAHPVEAGEPQPGPRQEDFQDVPQRSATPHGTATPIIEKPDTQEDAKDLRQRSATPLGKAEPKPEGDPVHQALTRDASVKQAAGVAGGHTDRPEPATKAGQQRAKTPKKDI